MYLKIWENRLTEREKRVERGYHVLGDCLTVAAVLGIKKIC